MREKEIFLFFIFFYLFLKTNAPLNLVLAKLAQVHRLGAAAAVAAASAQLAH